MTEIPQQLQKSRFIKIDMTDPENKKWKKPLETDWQNTRNYAYNDQMFLEYIANGNNYGVALGYGDIGVLDADHLLVDQTARKKLPDTFRVKTGGYYYGKEDFPRKTHFYFHCPGWSHGTINLGEDPGGNHYGEFRWQGAQVVGPGSKHYDTKNTYEIENDVPIATITPEQLLEVLKPYMKTYLLKKSVQKEHDDEEQKCDIDITKVLNPDDYTAGEQGIYRGKHPAHESKSNRNFIFDTNKNLWYCQRHGTGGGTLELIAVLHNLISCEECIPEALRENNWEKFKQVVKIAKEKYEIELPHKKTLEPLKQEILVQYKVLYLDGDKNKVSCPRLAKLILEGDNNHYLVVFDNQEILWYNGSYYEEKGERIVDQRINYYLGDLMCSRYRTEVHTCIKTLGYIKREELDPPLHLINFQNGILNIETWELIPHDKKHMFQYEIPTIYDKNAQCPRWEQFIKDVVYPEDIDFLQELCGYLLYRRYTWAIVVILLGHGRNGKTTYINVISDVIGKKNIQHIPLQTLAHDQHAKIKLYQQHANLCSEIGAQEIKNTEALKQLTGTDTIYARQLYKEGFNFCNYAKLVFSCNILPDIKDETLAMKERLAIIEFPNTFKRNDPECDPNIFYKLTTTEEKSGIINWMVIGLKRLLEKQNFSTYKDIEHLVDYKRKCEDPIYKFIETDLEQDEKSTVRNSDLYTRYKIYCDNNKLIPLNDVWFGRKLMQFVPSIWNITRGQKGKHTVNGLKIKGVESSQAIIDN